MFQFEATGGVSPEGEPVVQLIMAITLPLADADEIAKAIKQAGTRAVLAYGARQHGEPTVTIGQAEAPAKAAGDHHCPTC